MNFIFNFIKMSTELPHYNDAIFTEDSIRVDQLKMSEPFTSDIQEKLERLMPSNAHDSRTYEEQLGSGKYDSSSSFKNNLIAVKVLEALKQNHALFEHTTDNPNYEVQLTHKLSPSSAPVKRYVR